MLQTQEPPSIYNNPQIVTRSWNPAPAPMHWNFGALHAKKKKKKTLLLLLLPSKASPIYKESSHS